MAVVLHQFQFSHFNDKARWGLALKGVAHERRTYLPGPHMAALKKLSGQPATPVLDWHGEIIPGSAAILARLEREIPEPALVPLEPDQRERALALQAHYDDVLGPATRTVIFSALVNEGAYMTGMFGAGKPLLKRLGYRAMFPLARGLIAKGNGVNPENVKQCEAVTARTLDEVAELTQASGYHVGEHFSIADLTAACLLAPLANPHHPDMARPQPVPESVTNILQRYATHPAIAWVQAMYDRHRP